MCQARDGVGGKKSGFFFITLKILLSILKSQYLPFCVFLNGITQMISYNTCEHKRLISVSQTNSNPATSSINVVVRLECTSQGLPDFHSKAPNLQNSFHHSFLPQSCTGVTGCLPPGPRGIQKATLYVLAGSKFQILHNTFQDAQRTFCSLG